jgi:hypothetical protein
MTNERCANPSYAEDVDDMVLEYLIYSTTKACIGDFTTKSGSNVTIEPAATVLTQLHILNGKSLLQAPKNSC